MNDNYLLRALKQIPEKQKLIIAASRRAGQLANGARPMVKTQDQNHLDVALLEIAEGLISVEEGNSEEEEKE